ncbi:MAG: hypothetical protein GY756_03610 [bacterium]|nr:hypothetical protein [bacterium]
MKIVKELIKPSYEKNPIYDGGYIPENGFNVSIGNSEIYLSFPEVVDYQIKPFEILSEAEQGFIVDFYI